MPSPGQRLLSLLALHDRPLPRRLVAETLWPDTDEQKATARLRTTLWRVRTHCPDLVQAGPLELALSTDVWVDTRDVDLHARAFRATGELPDAELLMRRRGDLLPGYWDSWLIFDRERLRYELIHLLEAASEVHLHRKDLHLALLLALCAIDRDPLRESSNLLVISVHLAAGQAADVCATHGGTPRFCPKELGVAPPEALDDLLWQHRGVARLPGAPRRAATVRTAVGS